MACGSNITCFAERLALLESRMAGNLTEELLDVAAQNHPLDTAWVLTCGALVFLMQLGFAMLESGSVREQNVIATYMKNLLDLVLGTLAGALFGYYIAYGVHPMLIDTDDGEFQHRSFFFYVAFQSTAATIVSGAMAERTSITAYALLSILMSGVVYGLAVRFTWAGGWLLQNGYHDFAGSGVVHTLGGAAALVGSYLVGPRRDRWDPASFHLFAPSSVPSVLSGTLILWVGWYGFNSGSTNAMSTSADAQLASNAALTTTLAACTGGFTCAIISVTKSLRGSGITHDILALSNGILAGLVSITAGCDAIEAKWAMLIGAIGAVFYELGVRLRTWCEIDDIVEAFPVHCCCGVWGLAAVGLFHHEKGLFISGDAELLGWQIVGAAVMFVLGSVPVGLFSLLLKHVGYLRVSEEEEKQGIDHLFGMKAHAQTDMVLEHLTAIDGILKRYGYKGTLIEALEGVESHVNMMQERNKRGPSGATSLRPTRFRTSSVASNRGNSNTNLA
ncbi:hypothetical protein AB1Y20_009127 [Prymnesium parvum]|uniref:Ammonium transporter AmtB-like domain-containing protein n=1 Tax=Prymnesium parvum TaxID=97485 RepID=A0AB34K3G6_PRYPA|mmetsp:Transcript_31158/g.65299  ORF Transcript_31158/g.65299 Transcript_31158/m.65299 type:complete len:504 (+) Transcript_31158:134-1645(+)|eukprot:CAMPEP_0195570574 /NCGR_PEP_ID=MMETSP0814-20130614/3537_1 /TAXON_ID=97485 /ORGANISM="Prymnesium parvum, Strain Texoma1" /LENGTH=503 /DNA_ID=CAMNT_0040706081 /DNA_START=64 /DNA_END=1575 /DNA_ORIENTATION=-